MPGARFSFCVIVLVSCLWSENAVTATPTANPDPCRIFFGRPYPRKITTTTTEPPKTEEEIVHEARKEKVKQFESLLEEFLLWSPTQIQKPAPPPPPHSRPVVELQPEMPKTQPNDFNEMFDGDFLTKMVQFILY